MYAESFRRVARNAASFSQRACESPRSKTNFQSHDRTQCIYNATCEGFTSLLESPEFSLFPPEPQVGPWVAPGVMAYCQRRGFFRWESWELEHFSRPPRQFGRGHIKGVPEKKNPAGHSISLGVQKKKPLRTSPLDPAIR